MRFDRVISNPPFSQNYSREGMAFQGRFTHGFCPETGKKADLMFAQHMMAVLKDNGHDGDGNASWGAVSRGRREENSREFD
jgi:type I restriction enzyme M protein